jgi:hypothetical protein
MSEIKPIIYGEPSKPRPYLQAFATAFDDPTVKKGVENYLYAYGYGDPKKGLKSFGNAELTAAMNAVAYGLQKTGKINYYSSIDYNPWENSDKLNAAIAKFVSTNKRSPSEKEWNPIVYEGEYGSSIEDQRALQNGDKPWKYQITDTIRQKLNDFFKANPAPTPQQLQAFIASDPYMRDLDAAAKAQQQERADATAQGKGGYSFQGTPAEKYKDIDVEGLKALGYDPVNGWADLVNDVTKFNAIQGKNSPIQQAHQQELQQEAGTIPPQSRRQPTAQDRSLIGFRRGEQTDQFRQNQSKAQVIFSDFDKIYKEKLDALYAQRHEEAKKSGVWVTNLNKALHIAAGQEAGFSADDKRQLKDAAWKEATNGTDVAGLVRPFVPGIDDADKFFTVDEIIKMDVGLTDDEKKRLKFIGVRGILASNGTPLISPDAIHAVNEQYIAKYGHLPPDTGDIASWTALDPAYNNTGAVFANKAISALTLGAPNLYGRLATPEAYSGGERAAAQHPIASAAGELAGMALPIGAAGKGFGALGKGAAKIIPALKSVDPYLASFAQGALSMGSTQFVTDLNKGASLEQASKNLLTNMALGGFGEAGFKMFGDYLSNFVPKQGTWIFNKFMQGGAPLNASVKTWIESASKELGPVLAKEAQGIAGGEQAAVAPKPTPRATGAATGAVKPEAATVGPKGNAAVVTPETKAISWAVSPENKRVLVDANGDRFIISHTKYGAYELIDRTGALEYKYPLGAQFDTLDAAKAEAIARLEREAGTPKGNIAAAAAPEKAGAGIVAETESNPLFRNQVMGGANPAAKPAQAFETGAAKTTFRQKFNKAVRDVLDPQAGAKLIGPETYRSAITSRNAGTQVANILERNLVNRNGERIGDSLSKLLTDNLPKGQETEFWEYALQKANVGRAAEGKPIFSQMVGGKEAFFSSEESAARAALIEKVHPEWAQKAKNITKWIDDFMKEWGVRAGTIDETLYKELRATYPDYLPTNRAFNDLEDFIPGGSGAKQGFIDQTKPISRATGSTRNIVDPTQNIISLVNRTVRTARMNEVGQLLVDAIQKNPAMKEVAKIIKADVQNADNVVSVLVKGKPVYVRIKSPDLLDTMLQLNKVQDIGKLEMGARWLTTKFKSLITTKNPFFAVRNIARDVPMYLTNSQANPFRAIASLGKAGKDLVAADVINPALRKLGKAEIKTPMLDQYRGLGGEGANFAGVPTVKTAERLTGRTPILNKAGEITGYKDIGTLKKLSRWTGEEMWRLNDAFETAPRYAEFINARKAGKSLEEAIYDAAEITTNFSRGGKVLKSADAYVPYLNASVQGMARIGRALNPANPAKMIGTILKGVAAVTLPTEVLYFINRPNPNYQALDNRTKDNYFLIGNPFNLDENGYPKTFLKLPKAREYGVLFGSFFERLNRWLEGQPNAWKDFGQTAVTNIAPNNPLNNNIATPILNVTSGANKDWAGRTIVPESMGARSPMYQYDETTSEIAKWFGAAANDLGLKGGISPKQIDYLMRSYLGVVGQVGLPAATKSTYDKSAANGILRSALTQFTADPIYSNQAMSDFYDEVDKYSRMAADRNFKENIAGGASTPEERAYSALTKASKNISALSKQLTTATDPESIRKQMIQIATDALAAAKAGGGNTTVYPAGVDDSKRDAYDAIVNAKKGAIPEAKMQSIFSAFASLKPRGGNKTVTEKDRKDALWAMVGKGQLTSEQYSTFIKNYYPSK